MNNMLIPPKMTFILLTIRLIYFQGIVNYVFPPLSIPVVSPSILREGNKEAAVFQACNEIAYAAMVLRLNNFQGRFAALSVWNVHHCM
jgi:hypothetical protein